MIMLLIEYSSRAPWLAYCAFILFLVGALSDWLDGYIARKMEEITDLGKFVDQLADKAFVTGLLCVFTAQAEISYWVLAVIVLRDTYVSGIRMVAASRGTVIAANYWGKIKTVIQLVLIGALLINRISPIFHALFIVLAGWVTVAITLLSAVSYSSFPKKGITK